jgi:hypothetical protein
MEMVDYTYNIRWRGLITDTEEIKRVNIALNELANSDNINNHEATFFNEKIMEDYNDNPKISKHLASYATPYELITLEEFMLEIIDFYMDHLFVILLSIAPNTCKNIGQHTVHYHL